MLCMLCVACGVDEFYILFHFVEGLHVVGVCSVIFVRIFGRRLQRIYIFLINNDFDGV